MPLTDQERDAVLTYRRPTNDPAERLAHVLSEIMNDSAPLGWERYIYPAECLLASDEARAAFGSGKRTKKQCAHCTGEFWIQKPFRRSDRKYCSDACRVAAQRQRAKHDERS